MNNYQKSEAGKQYDEQAAYNKIDGSRQFKRYTEWSDEIISTPAKQQQQIEHWQVKSCPEKQPGDWGKPVLSDFHNLYVAEGSHTKAEDHTTLFESNYQVHCWYVWLFTLKKLESTMT